MHKNPASIKKEKLNFKCPICLEEFGDGEGTKTANSNKIENIKYAQQWIDQ